MPAGSREWGRLVLAVTFILMGVLSVTSITFVGSGVVVGAGLLIGGMLWGFGKP